MLLANMALGIAVLSILVLSVRFLQRHFVALPRDGGGYTEALIGAPQFINPILALNNDVDLDLTHLLFQGLYRINEEGAVERALASHEEVSEDGKTYVITLQQDALWHDGTPVTAEDVVFTFDRILDPESQSPFLKTFKDLRVEAVDEHTVKMTLVQPYAPFLSTLTVGILPAHIWSDIPAANTGLAEYNLKPIGSGPYIFQSLTKDRLGTVKSYRLIRFPKFSGQRPHVETMTFRFYPSQDEALGAVERHQVEGISFVSQEMRTQLEKERVVFQELRLPQYTAVFFNQRNVLLKEKLLRQTLERAISKDAIIAQALEGAGEPIHTPILPGFLGHNPEVKGLAYDVDAAKKALDDAGWSLFEGETVRKKNGKELRFTLTTVDRPEYTKTAQLLREYWSAVGVGVDIRLFSSNDIIRKVIKPRDYEALLFGEIIGTDPDPYPFWHSSQSFDPGLNLAIFYNKDVDQLLEEARQISDPEQRRMKYLHFQNILAEEQPAIFLYNPYYIYGLPQKIKGFSLQRITYPSDRFNSIEKWYVKTSIGWR